MLETTRCYKIKLRDGTAEIVQAWANELNTRKDEVIKTLLAEKVSLEAVFLDHQADGAYLVYMMRAPDFDFAAKTARESGDPIDVYHRAFKKACWERSEILPLLVDFCVENQIAQQE
jgi:hypothetical protein